MSFVECRVSGVPHREMVQYAWGFMQRLYIHHGLYKVGKNFGGGPSQNNDQLIQIMSQMTAAEGHSLQLLQCLEDIPLFFQKTRNAMMLRTDQAISQHLNYDNPHNRFLTE